MLGVDYRMPLSATGTAPAKPLRLRGGFAMPNGVKTLPVVERSVEISWDGGQTWKQAGLSDCGKTSCHVEVTNKAGGKASLRVKATDAGGRTVSQEIVNAYAVPKSH